MVCVLVLVCCIWFVGGVCLVSLLLICWLWVVIVFRRFYEVYVYFMLFVVVGCVVYVLVLFGGGLF